MDFLCGPNRSECFVIINERIQTLGTVAEHKRWQYVCRFFSNLKFSKIWNFPNPKFSKFSKIRKWWSKMLIEMFDDFPIFWNFLKFSQFPPDVAAQNVFQLFSSIKILFSIGFSLWSINYKVLPKHSFGAHKTWLARRLVGWRARVTSLDGSAYARSYSGDWTTWVKWQRKSCFLRKYIWNSKR